MAGMGIRQTGPLLRPVGIPAPPPAATWGALPRGGGGTAWIMRATSLVHLGDLDNAYVSSMFRSGARTSYHFGLGALLP